VKPVTHSIAKLRGGEILPQDSHGRKVIISPSVLAADWANMKDELTRCLNAGLSRIHVDIFDGVFLDSPEALTFGPQVKYL
jgi:pentose-5-phosphate-3-epimerase